MEELENLEILCQSDQFRSEIEVNGFIRESILTKNILNAEKMIQKDFPHIRNVFEYLVNISLLNKIWKSV